MSFSVSVENFYERRKIFKYVGSPLTNHNDIHDWKTVDLEEVINAIIQFKHVYYKYLCLRISNI